MKKRKFIKIEKFLIVFLLVAITYTTYLTISILSKTHPDLFSDKSENINPFEEILKEDFFIKEITHDDNIFRWSLEDNVDESEIYGFNYTIKINDNPIISSYTSNTELPFIPMYNGEFSFSVFAINNEQFVGPTKEYKFTVNNNNLNEFSPKDNEMFSTLYEETEFNKIFNKIIKTTDNTSLYDLLNLQIELKKVPLYILEDISKKGFKIYLTGYDLAKIHKEDSSSDISGLFNPSGKTIYISNSGDSISHSTIHEIGHYIDYVLGWGRYKSANDINLLAIYEEEKEAVDFYHHKANVTEYFAYSYSEFIKNPIEFKESHPKTFKYIEELMTNAENKFIPTMLFKIIS